MLLLAGAVFVVSGFLLLYPFVIYPLVLSVLPRRSILRQGAGGSAPRMALLLAARNEARDLPVTLRSLQSLKQHWPELEIMGWNDGSTDATAEILAGAAGILRPMGSDRPAGKAAALRQMMARTDAPILVFMDANVRFRANDLLDLRGAFDDPRIGAVGARTVHAGPAGRGLISRVYWALEERIKLLESATGSTMGCDGALWAIRRELYPAFDACASDDFRPSMEPLLRGLRVITLPGLAVRERPDPEASAARRAAKPGALHTRRDQGQPGGGDRIADPMDKPAHAQNPPKAKRQNDTANQNFTPTQKALRGFRAHKTHAQSPNFCCQTVMAATAAVSARRMRGPRLTAWAKGRAERRARSGPEKPPSGPMSTAQGCPRPSAGSAQAPPASASSQNIRRRPSGQSESRASSLCRSVTCGTQVPPHCSAASMAWA